jgi:hypothetical protein
MFLTGQTCTCGGSSKQAEKKKQARAGSSFSLSHKIVKEAQRTTQKCGSNLFHFVE